MSKSKMKSTGGKKRIFFTEEQLAQRWGVSKKLLQKQRGSGAGCPYYKLGQGAVRYRLRDIKQFEQDARRSSTSDPGPQP